MVVLSMNSKRQRRPNVRLGEIGDVSAAFACGISQKTRANLGQKRWNQKFLVREESGCYSIHGSSRLMSPEVTVLDPGVSPRVSAEMQVNRENKDPNYLRPVFEFGNWVKNDVNKSNLNFGTVSRKCRLMKRRRWSTNGKHGVFTNAWYPKINPDTSSGCGLKKGEKEVLGITSNGCLDFSCHETSATSKEACENDMDGPTFSEQMQTNLNVYWKGGSCFEGTNGFPQPFSGFKRIKIGNSNVNSVSTWLAELGFGKYSAVFEVHEVDEEALRLLTLEDLKEMGMLAVGPRRKLYTAIQQLKDGEETVSE